MQLSTDVCSIKLPLYTTECSILSDIWHCSSVAPAVCQLPSAAHTASSASDVWMSGFSMAGSMVWNSLLDTLRDSMHSFHSFCRGLKTFLSLLSYTAHYRLVIMHYVNLLLAQTMTYVISNQYDMLCVKWDVKHCLITLTYPKNSANTTQPLYSHYTLR